MLERNAIRHHVWSLRDWKWLAKICSSTNNNTSEETGIISYFRWLALFICKTYCACNYINKETLLKVSFYSFEACRVKCQHCQKSADDNHFNESDSRGIAQHRTGLPKCPCLWVNEAHWWIVVKKNAYDLQRLFWNNHQLWNYVIRLRKFMIKKNHFCELYSR